MDYQSARQLAEEKVDNPDLHERFLMFMDGRLVGQLSFHRGFHSGDMVASVTYRSRAGDLDTIFGAHVPCQSRSVFEVKFPGCDLQYTDDRKRVEREFSDDSADARKITGWTELQQFDADLEKRFEPMP